MPLSLKINSKPQVNYNFSKQTKNSVYSWPSKEKKFVMIKKKKDQYCLVLEMEVHHASSYWMCGNHHVQAHPASGGHNVRARRSNVDCRTDGHQAVCPSCHPLFFQKVRSALGYKL